MQRHHIESILTYASLIIKKHAIYRNIYIIILWFDATNCTVSNF